MVLVAPPGGFLFLSKERIKKMVSYDSNYEGVTQSGCCPRCGEDPCVCDFDEHPNSYYSNPPGEHEFHDDFDYSDREDIFPDPDDEEIFF